MSEAQREYHESSEGSYELLCPQCEAAHLTRRRGITICEACGYVESFEDNFAPTQARPREHADKAG